MDFISRGGGGHHHPYPHHPHCISVGQWHKNSVVRFFCRTCAKNKVCTWEKKSGISSLGHHPTWLKVALANQQGWRSLHQNSSNWFSIGLVMTNFRSKKSGKDPHLTALSWLAYLFDFSVSVSIPPRDRDRVGAIMWYQWCHTQRRGQKQCTSSRRSF